MKVSDQETDSEDRERKTLIKKRMVVDDDRYDTV